MRTSHLYLTRDVVASSLSTYHQGNQEVRTSLSSRARKTEMVLVPVPWAFLSNFDLLVPVPVENGIFLVGPGTAIFAEKGLVPPVPWLSNALRKRSLFGHCNESNS